MAKIIETDPLLRLLQTTSFKLPGRRNPEKRRNQDLTVAMRAVGVTVERVEHISDALDWLGCSLLIRLHRPHSARS